jgi:anti-anti-sigma factor
MIEYHDNETIRTFVLKDEIIASRLLKLEDTLNTFIREDDRNAVIDLVDINKIDSMALAALIRVKNKLALSGRSLNVINPSEGVIRVLEMAGLDSFLMD